MTRLIFVCAVLLLSTIMIPGSVGAQEIETVVPSAAPLTRPLDASQPQVGSPAPDIDGEDTNGVKYLVARIDKLLPPLADRDYRQQREAAIELKALGPATAPLLLERLEDAPEKTRYLLASTIGQLGNPDVIEPTLEKLQSPQLDSQFRGHLEIVLRGLGGQAREAISALASHDQAVVRESGVRLLSLFNDEAAIASLQAALKDSASRVRVYAASGLARRKDDRALAVLEAASKDPDALVRRVAVGGLGATGSPSALSILAELVTESDRAVSQAAISALGNFKQPRATAAIAETIKTDPSAASQAFYALSRQNTAEAAKAVAGSLKDDNAFRQQLARSTLGRMRVPEAKELLEQFAADVAKQRAGQSNLPQLPAGQNRIVAGITRLGGQVEHGVTKVSLRSAKVVDANLRPLQDLTTLQVLDLQGSQVGDAGLVHVARLPRLVALDLSGTQVTDAGLAHLQSLKTMRCLAIDNTQVTERGLADLKRAIPGLVDVCRDSHSKSQLFHNPENGHYYQRINVPMTWHKAKAYCESRGGYLATATTASENQFLYESLSQDHVCWLGGTDEHDEGTWEWVTDEPFDFRNWFQNEPSNSGTVEHYLTFGNTESVVVEGKSYFYRFGAKWNDQNATGKYHGKAIAHAICEWDR